MARPLVISFGGSILAPSEPDPGFLGRVAGTLIALSQNQPLLIVTGGGHPARQAIAVARAAGANERALDSIGIKATRLNAQTLLAIIQAEGGDVAGIVANMAEEAAILSKRHKIVVMGGTTPGHSTDYVGADLAVASNANKFIIATSVDAVYSSDPRTDPSATKFKTLTFAQLVKICGTKWEKAGSPGVVDGPASRFIADNSIRTFVLHGENLENLASAAKGEPFEGTIIGADQ